jgi:hypothetical protein
VTDAARRGTTAWRAVSDSPPSHKPGEFGYDDPRRRDGFDRLSFVITETQQNGGPPLHTVEEAHAVLSGMVGYGIGDQRLTVMAAITMRGIPAVQASMYMQVNTRHLAYC